MHEGSLARCVGDVGGFLEEIWDRRVHLHRGGDFTDLLSLDHVDEIVSTRSLRAPALRMVKAGSPIPAPAYTRRARIGSRTVTDLIDPGRVYEEFHGGATIVLQGLHRYWEPLSRFVRDLELRLTHPAQANAYITPPVSSGLRVHHDSHDVFALQTFGRKHWVAYPRGSDPKAPPAAVLDTELTPGDSLYVPTGTPHAARTIDAASIHITIGIRRTTWADLLRRALGDLEGDERFAEPLPPGYADDPDGLAAGLATRLAELSQWVAARDPKPPAEAASKSFWAARPPLLDRQLANLLRLDEVDDDTRVARRPGTTCRVSTEGARTRVVLGDRRLYLPAAAAPAMRWVAQAETFRVGDLDGLLDESGRAVLVRRLVREGLLVIADA